MHNSFIIFRIFKYVFVYVCTIYRLITFYTGFHVVFVNATGAASKHVYLRLGFFSLVALLMTIRIEYALVRSSIYAFNQQLQFVRNKTEFECSKYKMKWFEERSAVKWFIHRANGRNIWNESVSILLCAWKMYMSIH